MAAAKRRQVYQISKDSKTFITDDNDDGLFLVDDDDDFFDVEPVVITQHSPQDLQQFEQQQQKMLQQKLIQQQQHAIVMQQLKQHQQLQLQRHHHQQHHNQHIQQHHFQHHPQHHHQHPHHHQQQQQHLQQQHLQQQDPQFASQRPPVYHYLPHQQQSSPVISPPVSTTTTTITDFPSPTFTRRRYSQQITSGNSGSSWKDTFQQLSRNLQLICSSSGSRESLSISSSRPNSPISPLVSVSNKSSLSAATATTTTAMSSKNVAPTNSNTNEELFNNSQLLSGDASVRRISLSSVQFDEETLRLFNQNNDNLNSGINANNINSDDTVDENSNLMRTSDVIGKEMTTTVDSKLTNTNISQTIDTQHENPVDFTTFGKDPTTTSATDLSISTTTDNVNNNNNNNNNIIINNNSNNNTNTNNSNNNTNTNNSNNNTNNNTTPTKTVKTTTFSTVSIVADDPTIEETYDNVFDMESEINSLGFSNDHLSKVKVRHEETEVSLNRTLAMICRSNNNSPRTSRIGKFETEDDGDECERTDGSSVDGLSTEEEEGRKRRLSLECRLKNLENGQTNAQHQPIIPLIQSMKLYHQDQSLEQPPQLSTPCEGNNINRLSLDSSIKPLNKKQFNKVSKKPSLETSLLRFKFDLNQINPYTVGVSVDEENGFLTIFETACKNNSEDVEVENVARVATDSRCEDADSGILDISENANPKNDKTGELEDSLKELVITSSECKNFKNTDGNDGNSSTSSNSSGFEDMEDKTMHLVSPLSSPDEMSLTNDYNIGKSDDAKNNQNETIESTNSTLENTTASSDKTETNLNNNNANVSNSNIIPTTNQLHLLRLCERTSAERLCCTIEDNTLYIREKHYESEFLNFEGFQMKYLPIINEDLVNCRVVITLHVPEEARDNVQVKTIDNILVLSAGHSHQRSSSNKKTPSSTSSVSSSLSSSPIFSSSRPSTFRVALTLPPETVTRSIDAWISRGGQLIIKGATVVTNRRMTCNF